MADELRGERVAAVVEHGFEQVELTEPKKALEAAGAMVDVISPPAGSVTGWQQTTWGDVVAVDRPLADASSDAVRRGVAAGRRHESRQAAHESGGRPVRQGLRGQW